MRALVTGGAGYVGGFCSRHLAANGHDVTVLDNLSEGHPEAAPNGSLVTGDIVDTSLLASLLREREIEVVIHFAASCYVGESMTDPRKYYRNNVANSLSLLETLIDTGVKQLLFSSSCSVYGTRGDQLLSEALDPAPKNTYAFTKLAIETMIRDFARAYGLRFALLRYFNAAGATADGSHGEHHEPETHLIPLAIQTALGQRKHLEVFGTDYDTANGSCIRDYVHVSDLARAHETAALQLLPGNGPGELVCNLGSGTGTSVLELIQAIERVSGTELPIRLCERRPGDPARLVADTRRAFAELGWTPQYGSIEAIIETAWAWHRTHPDGYGPAASGVA